MAAFQLVPAPFVGEDIIPLDLAKAQCRVLDDSSEDTLLEVYRDAAIDAVQRYTSLALSSVTAVWSGSFEGASGILHLGLGPVSAITSIAYLDGDGATQTLAASAYRLGQQGRVLPVDSWPSGAVDGGVTITFTAGFATGAVPPVLKQAALMMIGHWYMNREAVVVGETTAELPLAFRSACDAYRLPVIG